MKKYRISWTNRAESDLTEIIEYIARDNPSAAHTVLTEFKSQADNLYQLPERGRIVPELNEQGIFQYRELIVAPWRLIYRVTQSEVLIITIIDSRQNVEDILLKRLAR